MTRFFGELGFGKWCWERIQSHLGLRKTLDTSILKLPSAYRGEDSGVCCTGLVERRAQITWRLSSRRRWVTSVETRGGRESRQRSNCTTTLVKWSDPGGLLTSGRTTGVGRAPVVRHSCDIEGYSRYVA